MFKNSTTDQVHEISFLQLIEVKVHDINTLLAQATPQSVGILRPRDTQINKGYAIHENQSLTSIFLAWTGSGCESLKLGWPPTPAGVPETTNARLQGRSLCLEHVSSTRSKCIC